MIGGAALVPPCDSPPPAPPPSPPSVPSEIESHSVPPNPRSAGEKICLHTGSFNTDADGTYAFTARFPARIWWRACPDDLLDPCDAQTNGAVILYHSPHRPVTQTRDLDVQPSSRTAHRRRSRPQADQALRQVFHRRRLPTRRAVPCWVNEASLGDESWRSTCSTRIGRAPDRPPIEEVLTTLGSTFASPPPRSWKYASACAPAARRGRSADAAQRSVE